MALLELVAKVESAEQAAVEEESTRIQLESHQGDRCTWMPQDQVQLQLEELAELEAQGGEAEVWREL